MELNLRFPSPPSVFVEIFEKRLFLEAIAEAQPVPLNFSLIILFFCLTAWCRVWESTNCWEMRWVRLRYFWLSSWPLDWWWPPRWRLHPQGLPQIPQICGIFEKRLTWDAFGHLCNWDWRVACTGFPENGMEKWHVLVWINGARAAVRVKNALKECPQAILCCFSQSRNGVRRLDRPKNSPM
jgi:hypothetical protein